MMSCSKTTIDPPLLVEPCLPRQLGSDIAEGALLGIRLLLAAIFGYAGLMKILSPVSFADALHGYDLFPSGLIPWLAVSASWLEWLIAAALLASSRPVAGMILAAGMSLVFAVVLSRVLLLGMSVSCGCFGAANTIVGRGDVVRAGFLFGLSILGVFLVWWLHHSRVFSSRGGAS